MELKYLKPIDIETIFDLLAGNSREQIIQIYSIDEAIRKNCNLNDMQMQDEIMDKIVRAFNGDDGFLLT